MSRLATPVPAWLVELSTPLGKADHPLREVVAEAVDEHLPPDLRRAVEAWAWEGLTFQEIATEAGLAGRQSGQKRVRWALRELGRVLKEHYAEELNEYGIDTDDD